jgi:AhpD family alkylhydroperoxidase
VLREHKEADMLHDAGKFYEEWPGEMNAMKARSPEIGRAFGPLFQGLMKDGALSAKTKELLAVGIAVSTRCEPCIYSHVEKAMKMGWTGAEVMEAAGVAVMMGGGPAYVYAPVVARAVEHYEQAHAGAASN